MDPQNTLIIIAALVIAAFAVIYFQIKKLVDSKSQDDTTKLLTQLVSDMRGSMDNTTDSMVRQTRAINERLDRAAQVISGVSKSVGQNFHLQYAFKGGEIVDAALKLEQGIIPIDAKFPMENFRKMAKSRDEKETTAARKAFVADVKKHIDAISTKYIRPAEGTLDFALMYIPSEPIYYEILTNSPDLDDYAYQKRVRPVSPNTLYAYLRAIIMSLEGSKIEKHAGQILSALREIGAETEKFGTSLGVLTRHIKNAAASSDDVNSRFSRLRNKVGKIYKSKITAIIFL